MTNFSRLNVSLFITTVHGLPSSHRTQTFENIVSLSRMESKLARKQKKIAVNSDFKHFKQTL